MIKFTNIMVAKEPDGVITLSALLVRMDVRELWAEPLVTPASYTYQDGHWVYSESKRPLADDVRKALVLAEVIHA